MCKERNRDIHRQNTFTCNLSLPRYTSFIAVDSKEAKAATADQIMVKRPIANQLPRGFGGGTGFATRSRRSAPLAMAAAPPPPTMMMANVRTTTAKIFWTKSPRFNNFRVSVTPPIDGKRNFDRNSTVLILENTKPSVEYKIEVVGLVDGAETDSSSINVLTGKF